MRIYLQMLMLILLSFTMSQPSFAIEYTSNEVIFSEDDKKTSDDEEPDCE